MGTILGIPAVLVALGVIIGGAITGLLYVIGIFGKARSEDAKDAREAAEFVITNLEKKISILQSGIAEQAKQILDMKNRMDQLDSDNQRMLSILQGRDVNTQRFQEEGFKVMQQSAQSIATINTIEQRVNRILEIIEHREVVVTRLHQNIQDTLEKVGAEHKK